MSDFHAMGDAYAGVTFDYKSTTGHLVEVDRIRIQIGHTIFRSTPLMATMSQHAAEFLALCDATNDASPTCNDDR